MPFVHRKRALLVATPVLAVALAVACSATDDPAETNGTGASSAGAGNPGGGTASSSASGGKGGDGGLINPATSGSGGGGGIFMNPCGTGCGGVELCDEEHLGFDDDCNGQVDETCACGPGQAHFCFKGDSSYHGKPGCYDGTEKCSELGTWDTCTGGVHATDNCYANDMSECHPISAIPFQNVDLKPGTGTFSANAVPGTETWTVVCPAGVNPCPAVLGSNPADDFKPLQSGEYTVTYTKGLGDGGTDTCQYPLFVGAPGLRVELEWEHDLGGTGVDLDLHVHKPLSTLPWEFTGSGAPQECTWSNCVASDFGGGNPSAPTWFDPAAMPPDPVNWFLDPVLEKNSCYFAPRGVGQEWQNMGLGCHNPRLDLDNITCDPTVSDSDAFDFCAPENVNIDFPPKHDWVRIGVHYYSNHGLTYGIHPRVKIYCDGQLTAELGPHGYYDPEDVVYFDPVGGDDADPSKRLFWAVADVAFLEKDQCTTASCVVTPLYGDDATKTPLFTYTSTAEASVGPPYPPPPSP